MNNNLSIAEVLDRVISHLSEKKDSTHKDFKLVNIEPSTAIKSKPGDLVKDFPNGVRVAIGRGNAGDMIGAILFEFRRELNCIHVVVTFNCYHPEYPADGNWLHGNQIGKIEQTTFDADESKFENITEFVSLATMMLTCKFNSYFREFSPRELENRRDFLKDRKQDLT